MKYPKRLKLWPHQKEAVAKIAAFVDAKLSTTRKATPSNSAWINIPTGGGKTAVIGTVAHWHPKLSRVLVLAPRTAIRDQLSLELAAKRGHFLRAGVDPKAFAKQVVKLTSTAQIAKPLPAKAIVVSTIQLVHDITTDTKREEYYKRLVGAFDAVFVDEGHYEPAPDWSQSIRGLGCPTVLVTATPYRNDLKGFELDPDFIHVSKYADLTSALVLRRIEVEHKYLSGSALPRGAPCACSPGLVAAP